MRSSTCCARPSSGRPGAATARRLAEAGWRVIGIDRRPGADVTGDAAEPAVLHDAMRRLRGPLDGLVCSAGLPPSGPWDDLGHWDEVIATTRPLYRDMPLAHYNGNAFVANPDNLFHWARIRDEVARDVEIARGAASESRARAPAPPGNP